MAEHFCYHCRKKHPEEEMVRHSTRVGFRWRCRTSVEATRKGADARAEFGRNVTAANKREASIKAQWHDLDRRSVAS